MANKDKKASPKADERNVVDAGALDLQEVEHQIAIFWEKNRAFILGSVAAVFAIFLGFQGIKYLQAQSELKVQNAYAAATTSEAKLAFAEAEVGHPLAGFAFKELGDEAYQAGEFAKAENHYSNALKSAESVVKDAAAIALAMALSAQDKKTEAKNALEKIANKVDAVNRAEAQYRLAVLEAAEGNSARVQELAESISDDASFWKAQAANLPGAKKS